MPQAATEKKDLHTQTDGQQCDSDALRFWFLHYVSRYPNGQLIRRYVSFFTWAEIGGDLGSNLRNPVSLRVSIALAQGFIKNMIQVIFIGNDLL